MGYKKVPTIHTLDKIKGLDGLTVRLKGLKVGKLRRLIAVLESDEQGLTEMLGEVFELLTENAVSWDLEDEGGNPVPFDHDGVEELELEDLMSILSAWMDAMTSVSEDLGKDSTSGGSFPGQPVTMEAL